MERWFQCYTQSIPCNPRFWGCLTQVFLHVMLLVSVIFIVAQHPLPLTLGRDGMFLNVWITSPPLMSHFHLGRGVLIWKQDKKKIRKNKSPPQEEAHKMLLWGDQRVPTTRTVIIGDSVNVQYLAHHRCPRPDSSFRQVWAPLLLCTEQITLKNNPHQKDCRRLTRTSTIHYHLLEFPTFTRKSAVHRQLTRSCILQLNEKKTALHESFTCLSPRPITWGSVISPIILSQLIITNYYHNWM